MNKVFKYGTGQEIPEGAVYLNTQVEIIGGNNPHRLVWHYFLVDANVGEGVA